MTEPTTGRPRSSPPPALGDIAGWPRPGTPVKDRIRALVMAAGTPIDAADPWGRQPLATARANDRAAAVAHLIENGAAE